MTQVSTGNDDQEFAAMNAPLNGSSIHEALRWALEENTDSSMASADWLVRDIDPDQPSAVALLSSADVSLKNLKLAKDAFKTMRIVGETAVDRSLASRLYLASIAAAMVRHGERISQQSDRALRRGLESMARDPHVARKLRELAEQAQLWLDQQC
jgi:hypothetical protein